MFDHRNEVRTVATGPGQHKLVVAFKGVDGKRRIVRDNIGTLTFVEGGVRVVMGSFDHVYPNKDEAIKDISKVMTSFGY